ncbi:MAG: hypothetical protein ABSB87_17900 [Terriglobales bacterium]
MSPHPDDLTGMKDDMTAFIEGLGMRRFFGYVECEEVPSVLWDSEQNPDGWKDFVELAKSTSAVFLTMHSWALSREELDRLSQVLAAEGLYRQDGFCAARMGIPGMRVRLRSRHRMVRALSAPARACG